jgi:predicted nucleotidyltransferase
MTKFEEILKGLGAKKIKFILIGGFAAAAHGSTYLTNDLDICYERSPENIRKLVGFLKSVHANLRDAPQDLPFILDEKTFSFSLNFTFKTNLGDLDLIGELPGIGAFAQALKAAEPLDLFGMKVEVLSLEGLIQNKKATGRPKDLAHLKELEAIREMKKR